MVRVYVYLIDSSGRNPSRAVYMSGVDATDD